MGVKRVSDNSFVTKAIFDIAITNYVRTLVETKSNRSFTPEQLEEEIDALLMMLVSDEMKEEDYFGF